MKPKDNRSATLGEMQQVAEVVSKLDTLNLYKIRTPQITEFLMKKGFTAEKVRRAKERLDEIEKKLKRQENRP